MSCRWCPRPWRRRVVCDLPVFQVVSDVVVPDLAFLCVIVVPDLALLCGIIILDFPLLCSVGDRGLGLELGAVGVTAEGQRQGRTFLSEENTVRQRFRRDRPASVLLYGTRAAAASAGALSAPW